MNINTNYIKKRIIKSNFLVNYSKFLLILSEKNDKSV